MDTDHPFGSFRSGMATDQAQAYRAACLEVLRLSTLFHPETYCASRGPPPPGTDPLADFHDTGWTLGHWPNPYFDPAWYRDQNQDVAASGIDPLLHYVSYGEQEGRRPVPWFDPAWYRARYQVPDGTHALSHFLRHRAAGHSPIPEFDSAWYLARYPDVAAAGMDPLEHYKVRGFREGRDPAPGFDTNYYRWRYLRGRPDEVPLFHYLRHRHEPGVHARMPDSETTPAREVARATAPGPHFEPVHPMLPAPPRAMALAFYLPQFHAIPENDAWWGTGFTEWTNLPRGQPRFAGHRQPRIPRDLGHYALTDPTVLHRQTDLARHAGLHGFVFYYYRFGRRRLLDRPLEAMLDSPTPDFPFCLMWANENWTRAWDGAEHDVLIAQDHARSDEAALIADLARHFADPRYIRLQSRPLLMVYRAGAVPGGAATVRRWRRLFRDHAGEDPVLVMAQSFTDADPRKLGYDAAVMFPPHGLVRDAPLINHRLDLLDPEFRGQVFDYADIAAAAERAPPPDYELIPCVLPGWDNDPRRPARGMVLHGATPARYQAWLNHAIARAQERPLLGTPLVCINAWNEWAEGAYLEPDTHAGAAFLNATARALRRTPAAANRLLLVGHDAFPAGAQLLLLHLAQRLRAAHGMAIDLVLCGEGALLPRFAEAATVHRAETPEALGTLAARLAAQGVRAALVGSAAAAWCCPILDAHGLRVTLLINEMPGLLADRGWMEPLRAALPHVARAVFPAETTLAAVTGREEGWGAAPDPAGGRAPRPAPAGVPAAPIISVLPQGIYRPPRHDTESATALRARLRIPADATLALGLGYGDRRKGFDLFLDVCRHAADQADAHFLWCGNLDPALAATLAPDIETLARSGRLHLLPWQDNPDPALNAADVLLLTSREDPYPSAALEALSLGIKVIAFAGSGGIPPMLTGAAGHAVPMDDTQAMADALRQRPSRAATSLLPAAHDFGAYTRTLLGLALPETPLASVAILCFRQADYIQARLSGILAQTAPVAGIAVHDDASADETRARAAETARQAGRIVSLHETAHNSGSPFGQWRHAVRQATGALIWLAEADDDADPDFLARLAPHFRDPSVVMAFTDSAPIDDAGGPAPVDYHAAYAATGWGTALAADATHDASDFAANCLSARNILFNVSAILWRRDALEAALARIPDLETWQVAGDWRVAWEVLTHGGRIAHIAAPLNRHRRAPTTASARVPPDAHLAEIRRMHTIIRARLGDAETLLEGQNRVVADATDFLRRK